MARVANESYRLGVFDGQYCVTFKEEGRRRRFRLGVCKTRPKVEGQAALNDWVRRREAAQLVDAGMTIGAIWAAYMADREAEGKDMRNVHYMWKSMKPTFSALSPADLEAPRIVDGVPGRTVCHQYALERERAGKSRDTIWTELGYIRSAVQWAKKRKHIKEVPYVWLPKKGGPREVTVDEHEAWRIIEGCEEPHTQVFLVLALATSARKSAILQLTWDRVDFAQQTIDFRRPAEGGILSKKGEKSRAVVAFGELVTTTLGGAREAALSEYVVEWNGKPIRNIRKSFQTALCNAGLQGRGITIHALRHSAATWWANAEVDMRMIQKMLGHRSIKTTENIYAKYSPAYLRPAADVIDLKMQR